MSSTVGWGLSSAGTLRMIPMRVSEWHTPGSTAMGTAGDSRGFGRTATAR